MTGDLMVTVAATRDPRAEAAIGAGLAAYNANRFRPGDTATLDILIHDEESGEPVGGLLGHTSLGLFSVRSRSNCSAARPAGSGVIGSK
jgi:hypothetical protein